MKRNSKDKKQEGFVLVAVAGFLIVLTAFVALGVDTGVLYSARTSAQAVADAAALAGAYTYVNSPGATQPQTASDYALNVALNNSIMGKTIVAGDVTVTPDLVNRTVTVTITATQGTYFAKVIGINSAGISVTSKAEAAEYSTGASCVKPWFVPNSVFTTGTVCGTECDPTQLLIDPNTKQVTAYGKSKLGQQFTVKPQKPSDALSPGNFYAIRFPGSAGGNDYRDAIEFCKSPYIRCGDTFTVEPGNMVGPTKQGVDNLVGSPSDSTWVASGQYQKTSDGKTYDTSPNVVVLPIWTSCGTSFCPSAKMNSGSLQIVGFATVFINGMSGNDVTARLISIASCGPSSSTGPSGGTALSLPLRLIKP